MTDGAAKTIQSLGLDLPVAWHHLTSRSPAEFWTAGTVPTIPTFTSSPDFVTLLFKTAVEFWTAGTGTILTSSPGYITSPPGVLPSSVLQVPSTYFTSSPGTTSLFKSPVELWTAGTVQYS